MTGSGVSETRAMDVFGLTDVGRARPTNQDHFIIASIRRSVRIRHTSLPAPDLAGRFGGGEALLLAVADGVGGQAGGELASSATVAGLLEYVGGAMACCRGLGVEEEHDLLLQLEGGIRATHETIRQKHEGQGQPPATTLTLALLVGPRAYIIHVGDSRAYCLHGARLRQITRDQTMGEALVDLGVTEAMAKTSRGAGSLTSAIGASHLAPTVGLVDLEPGDTLLLCSDGLTRHVPDEAIADILGRPVSAQEACAELVAQALAGGGRDNVTAVVARMIRPS